MSQNPVEYQGYGNTQASLERYFSSMNGTMQFTLRKDYSQRQYSKKSTQYEILLTTA